MDMSLRTYDPHDWPLFSKAMNALLPVETLIDVGAGIRPQRIVKCAKHICIEPYPPYVNELKKAGYDVICTKAPEALESVDHVDSVVMIDVIEHMEKRNGERAITLAQDKADQVVVFTPIGFMPQEGDAWGMGGDEWQRHRSGWQPAEFPGWHIFTDDGFHRRRNAGAFFAIWNRRRTT